MNRYEVIVSEKAEQMLKYHIEYLSRVSISGAKKLRNAYRDVLEDLEWNPYLFPVSTRFSSGQNWRQALFYGRYQAIFRVEENTVYLDAVVDCRMNPETIRRELE